MAYTTDIPVNAETWTPVTPRGGTTFVALQLKTTGPVLVQVAPEDPGPQSMGGMLLYGGAVEDLPLPGLDVADLVFLRSQEPGETNVVAAYVVT